MAGLSVVILPLMKTQIETPLWTPSAERIAESHLRTFMDAVDEDWNVTVDTSLYGTRSGWARIG